MSDFIFALFLVCCACGGIIAALALSAYVYGYVLSVLWGWFIVPAFALPSISISTAIGMTIIFSFLQGPTPDDDKSQSNDELIEKTINAFVRPLVALTFGWIITLVR